VAYIVTSCHIPVIHSSLPILFFPFTSLAYTSTSCCIRYIPFLHACFYPVFLTLISLFLISLHRFYSYLPLLSQHQCPRPQSRKFSQSRHHYPQFHWKSSTWPRTTRVWINGWFAMVWSTTLGWKVINTLSNNLYLLLWVWINGWFIMVWSTTFGWKVINSYCMITSYIDLPLILSLYHTKLPSFSFKSLYLNTPTSLITLPTPSPLGHLVNVELVTVSVVTTPMPFSQPIN